MIVGPLIGVLLESDCPVIGRAKAAVRAGGDEAVVGRVLGTAGGQRQVESQHDRMRAGDTSARDDLIRDFQRRLERLARKMIGR
jgi:hypothetical protein